MIISVFDRIENIVGKGENARYEHFLPFPQCFEKVSFPDTSESVVVWEWVNKQRMCIPFLVQFLGKISAKLSGNTEVVSYSNMI